MKALSKALWLIMYTGTLFTGIYTMAGVRFSPSVADFHPGLLLVAVSLLFLHKFLYGNQYIGMTGLLLLMFTFATVGAALNSRLAGDGSVSFIQSVIFIVLSVLYLARYRRPAQPVQQESEPVKKTMNEKEFWGAPLK